VYYDIRLDFIEHSLNLFLIQYVELEHIWKNSPTQAGAKRLPTVHEKFSLHLAPEQAAGYTPTLASSAAGVEINLPPVVNTVCIMIALIEREKRDV
jgi:hypothetical protein